MQDEPPGTVAVPCPLELVGSHIGPYKLREQLGEGGMGTVWAADQKHLLRRSVALKVIKPGMDSGQVLARFDAEREALALMDHPNIARVLDAGTTAQGRPYFVMELIHGLPITAYCDAHELPVRERLSLFIQVCRGVQHAHQKGIVHRDIKPSNVLVTEQDGAPIPKIIDFGVAKALHQPLADGSIYTGVFQALGTLAYMSPEQATMSPKDIDTRVDVYGLPPMFDDCSPAAFSHDGRFFALASEEGSIQVWGVSGENPPCCFNQAHHGPAECLAFDPCRPTLASGGRDGKIHLWDLDRRQRIGTLDKHGHRAHVVCLAYTPDGRLLASASFDNTIKLWDPQEPHATPRTISAHVGPVKTILISSSGRSLISTGGDNTVRIIDIETGQTKATFTEPRSAVCRLAISDDETVLASAEVTAGESIRFWRAR